MEITAATQEKNYISIDESLADRVKRTLEAKGGTIASLVGAISYNRLTVSRYLNGKYDSDTTDLEAWLVEWLNQQEGNGPAVKPAPAPRRAQCPRLFKNRDVKAVLGVYQSYQEYIGLGVVVGQSGHGKTYTLKKYAKLPRAAYIECDDTMSSRDLVEAIGRALGIPNGYGTIWKRVNGIRDFYNTNKDYLLIIDEADKLVSKYTQRKMKILRGVFDQADVGLVIAGEPELKVQIKNYLARMANRIDLYTSFRGLKPAEVEEYLARYDVTPGALAEPIARTCNAQAGCLRFPDWMTNNVFRIMRENGSETITYKIIEQASSMMML